MNIKLIRALFTAILLISCFIPSVIVATGEEPPKTILEGGGDMAKCGSCGEDVACKKYCGDYQLNDFLVLGVRISKMIIGIVGAVSLLAFVAGGIMFLASGGNNSLIERGKSSIIGAVIGLLIVFASYAVVKGVAMTFGITDDIFNSSWFINKTK